MSQNTVKLDKEGRLSVPPEVMERLGLRGGETLAVEVSGEGSIVLKSVGCGSDESSIEDGEARYRRVLAEAGIVVMYPTGKRMPGKRRLIEVQGKPISEQIIEDRR